MMSFATAGRVLCVIAIATRVAPAQQAAAPRPLGATIATSQEALGGVISVRHLPTGVLVNDMQNRRLILFDSTLATYKVIADTTPATGKHHRTRHH